MDLPNAENLQASAVNYLVQGDEHDAATVLLLCNIVEVSWEWQNVVAVTLIGPRATYDALYDDEHPIAKAVDRAFRAVYRDFGRYSVQAQFLDTLDPNWRTELLEIAAGRGVHNQGVEIPNRKTVIDRTP
jgi:hypothetical protein